MSQKIKPSTLAVVAGILLILLIFIGYRVLMPGAQQLGQEANQKPTQEQAQQQLDHFNLTADQKSNPDKLPPYMRYMMAHASGKDDMAVNLPGAPVGQPRIPQAEAQQMVQHFRLSPNQTANPDRLPPYMRNIVQSANGQSGTPTMSQLPPRPPAK